MNTEAYAAFLETLPGGAAVVDGNNHVRMINRRARLLLGAPERLEGLELKLGDNSARVRTLRRFDGGVECLSVRASPMTLDGEEMVLALLTPLDDDERVRQALQLVGNMGIFDHDHLTDLLFVSPEHRLMFGLPPDEVVTLPRIVAQVHPEDRERVGHDILKAHDPAGDGAFDCEYRIVRPSGEVRWLSTHSVTFFEGTGGARRPVRTVGAEIDVTHRRREETALRTWAHAIASSTTGLAVADLDGRITYVNRALLQAWGLEAEARATGHSLVEFCAQPEICATALATAATGRWSGDLDGKRADGTTFPALGSISMVRDPGGKPVNLVASFVDITERVAAETERRRLANVLDTTPDIVSVTRLDRQFLYINKAARRLRGIGEHESLAGRKLGDTLSPEQLANLEAGIKYATEHGTWWGESKMSTAGGEPVELSVIVQVHGEGDDRTVSVISRDITPQRRLESQLRQSQKMEAVGQLAGGVAHDFNNLLTLINASAELLLGDPALAAALRDDVEMILDAGRSAGSLTRQLLAFSRKQVLQLVSLNLNDLVASIEKMLRRVIGEDIELRTHPAPALWATRVDRGQMEQVLVNLAVNARDAMPNGGTLSFETGNVVLDEEYARAHSDVTAGEYVLLAVTDDGEGMPPHVLQRVFEPFFSTKGARGTGLGLATVYGIIRQSAGHVQVTSAPGRGASFKIYLPRDQGAGTVELPPTPLPFRALAPATILVVEDSEGVRELIRRILEKRGHRVFTAAFPDDALALGQLHALDLLVTDVVMPRLSGRELADALKQKHPSLQVLFMSGYTANAIAHHGVLDVGLDFIAKPFAIDAFSRKVDELLSRR